jgi:hypothetical protein
VLHFYFSVDLDFRNDTFHSFQFSETNRPVIEVVGPKVRQHNHLANNT